MREIGSEFWETETDFASLTGRKTYLAGRTALTAVIVDMKSRGIKKVSLPDYCCESMIEPFLRQDMKFAFYPIRKSDSGMECLLESSSDCEAVMLVNYFGSVSYTHLTLPTKLEV